MSALDGRRVLVTRPAHQSGALATLLREAGALPVILPTIEIAPPASFAALDTALGAPGRYDWIVFTSVNGVDSAFARAAQLGVGPEVWQSARIAAIGPATAAALHRRGARVDAVPDEYRAERIVDATQPASGTRFLLLRANLADRRLRRALEERGAQADDVIAYRTLLRGYDPGARSRVQGVDAITFTSSSTVRGFVSLLGEAWREAAAGAAIASIGPITSATARAMGIGVDAEAAEHTMAGLVAALAQFWTARPSQLLARRTT
jgi:uroporphyrinogen III methyltransferase/synthase